MKNLLKGNYDEAGQEAQDNIPQLVSYFIAALIGLALLLLSFLFLCCCCLCPTSCPPCCKQPKDEINSRTTMVCTSWVLIFLGLLIIACMATVLIGKFSPNEAIRSSRCGLAIFFDDILNGNVTM